MSAVDAAGVAELFQAVLGRPPESVAVVAHHVALGLDRDGLTALLLGSSEARERTRRRAAVEGLANRPRRGFSEPQQRGPGERARVLLWGAYGNGNLGDGAQAVALADLLRPLLPEGTVFVASSWERRGGFAPPGGGALGPEAVIDLVRGRAGRVDLVVVGGGGLFGTPHFPLAEPAWADAVVAAGIQVALLGVGGAAAALAADARAYDVLLRHAVVVGARDAETLLAVRRVRPDATWFPDPVLARAVLAATPDAAPVADRPIDTLLIPRAPNGGADAAALDAMLGWRTAALTRGMRVEVAVMEPSIDRPALAGLGFAGEAAHQPAGWPELLALCGRSRRVASMRLHGTVAGLEAGCVTYGLVQPKTRMLFEELGLRDWFSAGWTDFGNAPGDVFGAARAEGFAAMRGRLGAALSALRAVLAGVVH